MPRAGPRTIVAPLYTLTEAAHYLQIPAATLRTWVKGRSNPRKLDGSGFVQPIIEIPDDDQLLLCFANLVEAHALDGIRRPLRESLVKRYNEPTVRDGRRWLLTAVTIAGRANKHSLVHAYSMSRRTPSLMRPAISRSRPRRSARG